MPRFVAIAAVVVFVALNAVNALHKGGDFDVFLETGARELAGQPLYDAHRTGPEPGIVGPPFQGVFFLPFAGVARVSLTLARVVWYAIGVAGLFGGAWLWWRASPPEMWAALFWPLAAIAFPAQTNFEFQNMNAVLLGILGGAAYLLVRKDSPAGGALLGVAAALKVYPALVIVYLAARRQWRAAISATLVALGLTLIALLRYGWSGGIATIRDWLTLRASGDWFAGIPSNQSIVAVAERVGTGFLLIGAAIVVVALVVAFLRSARSRGPISRHELALTVAASVLLSPIAWDHAWVLMFPVFLVVYLDSRASASPTRRLSAAAFWIAALLTTGVMRATVGQPAFSWARWHGNSTVAGLLLVAAASVIIPRRERSRGLDRHSDLERTAAARGVSALRR